MALLKRAAGRAGMLFPQGIEVNKILVDSGFGNKILRASDAFLMPVFLGCELLSL